MKLSKLRRLGKHLIMPVFGVSFVAMMTVGSLANAVADKTLTADSSEAISLLADYALDLATYKYTGSVTLDTYTLSVEGTGTFAPGSFSGSDGGIVMKGGTLGASVAPNTLEFAGDVSANADNIKASTTQLTTGTLTITGGTLTNDITGVGSTNGTVKFTAGTLAARVTTNMLEFAGSVSADADKIKGDGVKVSSGTLTITGGTLTKTISGSGTVKFTGGTLAGASDVVVYSNIEFAGDVNSGIGKICGNTNKVTAGTLTLTGSGSLDSSITGTTGTSVVFGDGSTLSQRIVSVTISDSDVTVAENCSLTMRNYSAFSGGNVTNNGAIDGGSYGTITIASGKTLTNNSGKSIGATVVIANGGTLANSGTISGDFTNKDTTGITNAGTLSGTLTNEGKLTNTGTISGGIENKSGATLTLSASAALIMGGNVTNAGTISGTDGITNNDKELNNTGTISVAVTNGNIMTTTANGITGGVTNTKTLTLTGGDLGSAISGSNGTTVIDGTVTNDNGMAITQKGLKINSEKSLSTNADKLSITDAISNNGTLELTGGTLSNNPTGSGTLKISTGLVKYSGSGVIGNKTVVMNGGTLDPAANLLNADTIVESGGALYISEGELLIDSIKGEGTTYLKVDPSTATAQTITVKKDASIIGTLNGSGSTIDMSGDSAYKTLTIGTLADTTNLKIDVDMSNFASDKLSVGAVSGTPTVNLTDINIVKDYDFSGGIVLKTTEDNKVVFVDGAGKDSVTYTVTSTVYTNNYEYTFNTGTNKGALNCTIEAANVTFTKLVKGELASGSLSLTSDFLNGSSGGDITQGTKPITVNLNGHSFTSDSATCVVVGADKTFNLNGGNKTDAGTVDASTSFKVDGTMIIGGNTALNSEITGTGTVEITAGTVNVNKNFITQNNIKIETDGASLTNVATIRGNDSGSTIEISAGTVSGKDTNDNTYIYNGSGPNTTVSGNTIKISGGTIEGYNGDIDVGVRIYGGWANNLPVGGGGVGTPVAAKKNTVTIGGETLTEITLTEMIEIYGGIGGEAVADDNNIAEENTVTIKGGTITGVTNATKPGVKIEGGRSNGTVNKNTLTISGGTLTNVDHLIGGFGKITTNNQVTIFGGTIAGCDTSTNKMVIVGGKAFTTEKSETNTVTITGGKLTNVKEIYGGYSENGQANKNTLVINNSDASDVFTVGNLIAGRSGAGATGNTLTISEGAKVEINSDTDVIIGGHVTTGGDVSQNAVTVSGGTLTKVSCIAGGLTASGAASNNTVEVDSTAVVTKVNGYNGFPDVAPYKQYNNLISVVGGATLSGNAASNTVTLATGTYEKNIYGGLAGGAASSNTVTISDGTYKGDVYGGYSASSATGNEVQISGGTFEKDIYAGYAPAGSTSGNKVTITGTKAVYLGSGTIKADNAVVVGNGTEAAKFTVGDGSKPVSLTFESNTGAKLNLMDKAELAVTKNATVTLKGDSTVNGKISGEGVLENAGTMTVVNAANLALTNTDGITNTDGTVILGNGTSSELGAKINGGNITIDGLVTSAADKLAGAVTVNSEKTLTLNAGTLSQAITNNGTVELKDATLDGAHVTAGTLKIAADTTVTDAAFIAATTNVVDADATLELTGGTLAKEIANSGTVKFNGGTLNGKYVTTGTLEFAKDLEVNPDYVAAETNTIDSGITVTLTNGTLSNAVSGAGNVKVGGEVSADPTLFTHEGTLEVTENKTLTFTGTGKELSKAVKGAGAVKIDGTISTDASLFTQTGGVEVSSGKELILTKGTLIEGVDITNKGKVKTTGDVTIASAVGGTGGTSGTLIVENGTLKYTNTTAGSITNNVEIKAGATLDPNAGVFAAGTTVTNYGTLEITGGTLAATINGQGATDTLILKDQMSFASTGKVKQAAGSNLQVEGKLIEADTNDSAKALFKNVTSANQLDVKNGTLTIEGTLIDDKYYVLAEGSAVGDTIKDDSLWDTKNIKFDPRYFKVEYDVSVENNSLALLATNSVTFEEANTAGLAAVQQGASAVTNEVYTEMVSHLDLISRPSLGQRNILAARNMKAGKSDEAKISNVEIGKTADLMPENNPQERYAKEVWASMIHSKQKTDGMKLYELQGKQTAQYNGVVVGADFYTTHKVIAGAALSYASGNVNGSSGLVTTKNNADYYGVSVYNRVTNGNDALTYDVGYSHGKNEITQHEEGLDLAMDAKTDTYTAGVKWERVFNTGRSNIVPFAALRYMRLNSGDYTNNKETTFAAKDQNLFVPKVGAAWSGEFPVPGSDWNWRPKAEVGYQWNLGDRRTKEEISTSGEHFADIEYDTMDKGSFYTKVGMEFIRKNITAGVDYRYLKGDSVRNDKWNVNVNYRF